jgi:hypothetical protein
MLLNICGKAGVNMASISGVNTPVVPKTQKTFRKRDRLITEANSDNDTVGGKHVHEAERAISSGSIVSDGGVVTYFQDLVYGVTMMGRTNTVDRVPSAGVEASRNIVVDLGDNMTDAVVPTYLVPHLPQLAYRHTGNQIMVGQSVTDEVVSRVANSGSF